MKGTKASHPAVKKKSLPNHSLKLYDRENQLQAGSNSPNPLSPVLVHSISVQVEVVDQDKRHRVEMENGHYRPLLPLRVSRVSHGERRIKTGMEVVVAVLEGR